VESHAMDCPQDTGDETKADHNDSPLRLPVSIVVFLLWSGFMFYAARDIPGFDGVQETAMAVGAIFLISFVRSSTFRESKWLLPAVLCVAWAVGVSLGFRMSPKPSEIVPPKLRPPLTINRVQLGMTQEQVKEILSVALSESGPVKTYKDTKVEFRNGVVIAIDGTSLELEGKKALTKGDPKSKIRRTLAPSESEGFIPLEYSFGSNFLRFNTSKEQIKQIVLYEGGLDQVILRPEELSFD